MNLTPRDLSNEAKTQCRQKLNSLMTKGRLDITAFIFLLYLSFWLSFGFLLKKCRLEDLIFCLSFDL